MLIDYEIHRVLFVTCRSADGQILVVSSSDGYCTVVKFDSGELGVPLPNSELSVGARRVTLNNTEVSPEVSPPTVHNVVSVPPSDNQTTPHRENTQVTSLAMNCSEELNRKPGPRRVQLITLSTIPQGIASSSTATTPTNTATQHDTSTVTPIVL